MSLPAQFRNQRVHGILNWRLAMPYLQSAAASELDPMASTSPSSRGQWPEWDEARREGCESPLELRLLRAMRTTGLPEPVKQHEVYESHGRLLTRANFAYLTPKRILIYADGLEFHSAIRQRIHAAGLGDSLNWVPECDIARNENRAAGTERCKLLI